MSAPEAEPAADALPLARDFSVITWNMDHWKRSPALRRDAWSYLATDLRPDVALLQECVPQESHPRAKVVYRQLAGSRPWGSAVAIFSEELGIDEIGSVRTRYSSTLFPMLGTYPGSAIVAQVDVPAIGSVTCVSVYGLMENAYSQTTMLRIVADLIPLFDSPAGDRVVLGGDFNVSDCGRPSPLLRRYEAILKAVESLGLTNLAELDIERPGQLENCLCGAESCHHLHTYGENPGHQLDWLYATPELAGRCRRLRVERERSSLFSDHAPIIAEFSIPRAIPNRRWSLDSFVQELAERHGASVGSVASDIIAWAQRKNIQLQKVHPYATLDRLPISEGSNPELWLQLDLRYPESLGYTISMTAKGAVRIQFKNMRAPPFSNEESRRSLYDAIAALPGVCPPERLNGLPSFPIAALGVEDNTERFLAILESAIDQMVDSHKRAKLSGSKDGNLPSSSGFALLASREDKVMNALPGLASQWAPAGLHRAKGGL